MAGRSPTMMATTMSYAEQTDTERETGREVQEQHHTDSRSKVSKCSNTHTERSKRAISSADNDEVLEYCSSPIEEHSEGLSIPYEGSDRDAPNRTSRERRESPVPSPAVLQYPRSSPSSQGSIHWRDWLSTLLSLETEYLPDELLVHQILTTLQQMISHTDDDSCNIHGAQLGQASPSKWDKIHGRGFVRPTYAFLTKSRSKAEVETQRVLAKKASVSNIDATTESCRGETSTLKTEPCDKEEELEQERMLGEDDYRKWIPLYKAEHKKNARLKTAHAKLRTEAWKLYEGWPKLRRDNKDLSEKLAEFGDDCTRLRAQLAESKKAAAEWQAEYHQAAHMYETQRTKREGHFETQMKEIMGCMRAYQKAYHDRMPERDADWWKVEGLRKKVEAKGEELRNVGDRLETVKLEKQVAYQHIERLKNEKKELVAENERLRQGAPPSPPPSDNGNGNAPIGRNSRGLATKYRWADSAKAKKRREQIMAGLREKQTLVRKQQEDSQDLVEGLRRWRMGPYYPPFKNGWEEGMQKTSWVRWEGERYKREMVRVWEVERMRDEKERTQKRA